MEEQIIKALESKLGTEKEAKDRWRELGMILRNYRHNPAHYSGDRIESYEEAEGYSKTIINTIHQMSKYLVEKGVIGEGETHDEEICKIS